MISDNPFYAQKQSKTLQNQPRFLIKDELSCNQVDSPHRPSQHERRHGDLDCIAALPASTRLERKRFSELTSWKKGQRYSNLFYEHHMEELYLMSP